MSGGWGGDEVKIEVLKGAFICAYLYDHLVDPRVVSVFIGLSKKKAYSPLNKSAY